MKTREMLGAALALFLVAACKTSQGDSQAKATTASGLSFYEAARVRGEDPRAPWSQFTPATGIVVTQRNAKGEAIAGEITVLVDRPKTNTKVTLVGAFNDWGKSAKPEDDLQEIPGQESYMRGKIRQLTHLMEYRLVVDGTQLLDPSSYLFTTPDLNEKLGRPTTPAYLNAIFWDHDHPGAYHRQNPVVDLREKPVVIGESEVFELVGKWPRPGGGVGPDHRYNTYRFIAESGVIDEMKRAGYNTVEFLPFNQSVDGDRWIYRYQVYGLFAPESKYGTPDEFAMMIDAFNKAGIGVIMDAVVGHYPFNANQGVRALVGIGIHQFKKPDGKSLFGQETSPWGTYRYDYANPFIRRFLTDSLLFMLRQYGISGIRFDNLDGIRLYDGPGRGGDTFLKTMVSEVRQYQPSTLLIGEMFFGYNPVVQARADGGFGINYRTHSDLFDFFMDNMQLRWEDVAMDSLRNAIRKPWDEWQEASRCQYITNHDEAANARHGATGAYVASLVKGGGSFHVNGKSIAFASTAMLSGSVYMDMPQLRLLQEGSFNDNPTVDWSLRSQNGADNPVYRYFADLTQVFKSHEAFAFKNYHANIENHTDQQNKVISFRRTNQATGKSLYAIINLSAQELNNYNFGVDATHGFTIILDSNRKPYGGTDALAQAVPTGTLDLIPQGNHGKSHSVTLPVLPAYGVVVLSEE